MDPIEEKQELSDILISESDHKMSGSKKILLLGGAGTLLFMVAIFVVYTLNKDATEQADTVSALPPKSLQQNTLQPTPADAPLFEQVPIKESASAEEKFEQIVNDIKEKQQQEEKESIAPKPAPVVKAPELPRAPEAKPAPKPVPAPAPVVQAPKPTAPKPAAAAQQPVTSVPSGFYVQVGAFFRFNPDRKFIETIRENNLSYQLFKVTSSDREITKVLIGPFDTRQQAASVIGTIREKINKQAFITKV